MTNPFTMKSWSPYVVGIGIGVLSWFAFATADKHLAITLQYEHIAAMAQMILAPEAAATNRYYAARAQAGLEPKIGWYLMLLVGVFIGALLSSWLSGDRSRVYGPAALALALWREHGQAVCRRVRRAEPSWFLAHASPEAAPADTASAGLCNSPCKAGPSSSSPSRPPWRQRSCCSAERVATMFEVESAIDLALGLLTGIAFGFLLQKGRVAKYQTILGQLLLKDWTTFKIMITAILTGSAGVYFLIERGAASLDIWPFQPAAMLIGALLFGVGLAVLGYCPGTGMAGAGEGSRDAMVGVLGMITGAGVLVVGYNILEPVALALGDWGKLTVPALLGSSPWTVIAALALIVAAMLALLARYEPRHRAAQVQDTTGT